VVLWATRYVKAGPNEVLIVSGRTRTVTDEAGRRYTVGYRLVWGATFVMPIKERVQRLSPELLTIDIQVPDAYTAQGIRISVDAVAQVKVRGDEQSVAIAAEQFLSRPTEDIGRVAHQVVEGHLRAVLGTVSVEDVYLRRQEIARRAREAAEADLARMGLEVVSLTIHQLSDSEGYLEALGRPRVAQVKRDAVIGGAQAEREAQQVRFAAQTEIEAARRDHEVRKAEFQADVARVRAQADLAYDLERHRVAQTLKAEELKVVLVEKELQTQIHGEGDRPPEPGAAGHGDKAGRGRTAAHRAPGPGLGVLPKIAEAVSNPLTHVERIEIFAGPDGSGGASRITRDIGEMIAQLPALVEALTGQRLQDLIERAAKTGTREPTP